MIELFVDDKMTDPAGSGNGDGLLTVPFIDGAADGLAEEGKSAEMAA